MCTCAIRAAVPPCATHTHTHIHTPWWFSQHRVGILIHACVTVLRTQCLFPPCCHLFSLCLSLFSLPFHNSCLLCRAVNAPHSDIIFPSPPWGLALCLWRTSIGNIIYLQLNLCDLLPSLGEHGHSVQPIKSLIGHGWPQMLMTVLACTL